MIWITGVTAYVFDVLRRTGGKEAIATCELQIHLGISTNVAARSDANSPAGAFKIKIKPPPEAAVSILPLPRPQNTPGLDSDIGPPGPVGPPGTNQLFGVVSAAPILADMTAGDCTASISQGDGEFACWTKIRTQPTHTSQKLRVLLDRSPFKTAALALGPKPTSPRLFMMPTWRSATIACQSLRRSTPSRSRQHASTLRLSAA